MNTEALWRRIERYVSMGRETPKVDLKLKLDLSGKPNKAEFAKDITAIANTPGGEGFIIIGVKDLSDRESDAEEDYIVGLGDTLDADQFEIQMNDALDTFCDRMPAIQYVELEHPSLDREIGVIKVERSVRRPHAIVRTSGDVQRHDIYIRRGTATYHASSYEIRGMIDDTELLPPYLVINLSSHNLTSRQKEDIEREVYIEELIESPVHFDSKSPIVGQLTATIKAVGITLEEWQSKRILIALPGLTPPTTALLAYIHGLRGSFPRVIWLDRDPVKEEYRVASILDLQNIRDRAQDIRTDRGTL